VVIPSAIRAELEEHARAEEPNEACGLVLLRDSVATEYVRGTNGAASPYRFELQVDPEAWFLEDEGYELAVFHSHPSSPAGNVPLTFVLAAVIVERRKTGES